ncbi:MAG: hypothetical protein QXX08_10995 [Candidatus Bathyarchaeia archaeon]
MFDTLLTDLAQEPPVPTPSNTPDFGLSPITLIVTAIAVSVVIAWKYKAILELVAIVCSTIGGFIIGLILTPPYANIGLGIMTSFAALFLSTALIIIIKLSQKTRQLGT